MLTYSILSISDVSDCHIACLCNELSVYFGEDIKKQRKESVVGKALLVHMLKTHYGLTDFSLACKENGKPYLIGSSLYFNISHSDDCVLCVCGYDEIGCDIENIRPYNKRIAERFYTEAEFAKLSESRKPDVDFTRMWTLKESALKFSGDGLSGGLGLWDFSEHYDCTDFRLKDLSFTCIENKNMIMSICSADNELVELKTDINKILRHERGTL